MIFESIRKYVSIHDRKSANNIYAYCMPIIRKIAYRFYKNRNDVEDGSMLAMSRIFHVLNTYSKLNSETALNAWIKKVTYNVLITEYNSRKAKNIDMVEYSDNVKNHIGFMDSPTIERDDIEQYMKVLSNSERETFELYYLKGKSNREISEILGISVNASKVRLHRSVEKIKNNLK